MILCTYLCIQAGSPRQFAKNRFVASEGLLTIGIMEKVCFLMFELPSGSLLFIIQVRIAASSSLFREGSGD